MITSTFGILNNARQNIIQGDDSIVTMLYNRACVEHIPNQIISMHQMTKGYMMLAMAEYSPISYFEDLKNLRSLADKDERYAAEYKNILETLINFKQFFLRDVAVNYFMEVCTCSWNSNYGKSLDNLYLYLDSQIRDIIDNDRYGLSAYIPGCDMKKLERELKTVEAYALNLLLMYVTHKNTQYTGKSYYANSMDFGDYSLISVTSHDNYSHDAVSRPRINQVYKEVYYNDYLAKLRELSNELKIHPAAELKREVGRLVDRSGAKNELEKEYFKYSKRMAKEDPERRSFYNVYGSIYPGYNELVKPILKVCLGVDEVGSFELAQPFTRKRWLGVCNMLAWANDWSIEMVRTIMFLVGLTGIGVLAYIGLYLAMKANCYIPNFSVDKHI